MLEPRVGQLRVRQGWTARAGNPAGSVQQQHQGGPDFGTGAGGGGGGTEMPKPGCKGIGGFQGWRAHQCCNDGTGQARLGWIAGAGSTCEGVDLFTLDAINKWHSHIFFTCRRCRECSYIGKQSRIRGPDSRGCVIRSCDSFCGLGQVAAVYRRLRQAWAWSETRRRIKEGVLGVGQAQAAEGGCKPGRVLGWGG